MDGQAKITVTMNPEVLSFFLDRFDVDTVQQLGREALLFLCYIATPDFIFRIAEETPGGPRAVINQKDCDYIDSDELGYDIVKRLWPEEVDEDKILFDPQYSPVNLEIRVIEVDAAADMGELRNLSTTILETIIEPPNLA